MMILDMIRESGNSSQNNGIKNTAVVRKNQEISWLQWAIRVSYLYYSCANTIHLFLTLCCN